MTASSEFPKYKMVSVSGLIPYARNSRTHSDAQVAQIAASIREFGFLNPVIVDGDNGIIAGHGRVMAAQKLGIAELPCIEASHLTDAQRRAYVIVDNRMAELSQWDFGLLRSELADIDASGIDIDFLGDFEISFDDDRNEELPQDVDAHASETPPESGMVEPEKEKGKRNVFPVLISLNRAQYEALQAIKRSSGMDETELFVERVLSS